MVGLYTIAAPVGGAEVSGLTSYPNRGYFRYGGDVYVITASDHSKMSQLITALKLGQMPPRSKVSQAVVDAVAAGNELPGWQIIYWGARRRLIFNIPNPDGTFDQHVYNPALDAWSRYKGIPAICWAVWENRLFFGTPQGVVCEHGVGASDILAYQQNTVIPINVYGQQAWNLFETPLEKRVAAIRPVIQAQGDAVAHVSLGFDYGPLGAVTVDVNEAASASPWDTSPWDTSPWSSETAVSSEWHIAGGDGSAISVAVAAYGLKRLTWVRTDFRLEPGKAL